MYFSSTSASRRTTVRQRALRSLQVALVIAFALFISVANAAAQDEQQAVGDPAADAPPAVVDNSTQAPDPVVEPAPVDETAPAADPAPTGDAVEQDAAPVVASTEHVSHDSGPVDTQQEQSAFDRPNTPSGKFCHANNSGDWTETNWNGGLPNGHSGHTYDVWSSVPGSGSQNTGTFVRDGKVYNGAALLAGHCVTNTGYVADVNEIVDGPITMCHENGTNTWQKLTYSSYATFSSAGHNVNNSAHNGDIIPSFSYYTSTGGTATFVQRNTSSTYTKSGVTKTGAELLALDCVIPPPVDECSNIDGNQSSVPAGLVQRGGRCLGEATGCLVQYGIGFSVVGLTPFTGTQDDFDVDNGDIVDWTTAKYVRNGGVATANDRNLGTTFYRVVGFQLQSRTGQQLLDNGCSFAAPVPPAVTCLEDQDPLDDGSAPGTQPNDGVTDACRDWPDASCQYADQHPEDQRGGPSKETCVDNPDVTCAFDDQHPADVTGGPSKEQCVDNPPADCQFDEEPFSQHGSPTSLESCRGVAMPNCSAPGANASGIAIDTNANGNLDTCATLVAQFSCRSRLDDGTVTYHWTWTNPYGVTVVAPLGIPTNHVFGAVAQTQGTSFASGTGTSSVVGLSSGVVWQLTGGMGDKTAGDVSGTPCFQDQCPNGEFEPGDQQTVPAGYVKSTSSGSCVPTPPTCLSDELGSDDGLPAGTGRYAGDGVNDHCVVKPDVTCSAKDEVPTDTNGNGSLDRCVPTDIVSADSCTWDETATDTNHNGALDTCVPKPPVRCGLAVGIDTTGNGSLDTCVQITPIIDCGVNNGDGTRTLHWRWRNASGHDVTVPVGVRNVFFSVNQPTSFPAGEGSFQTTVRDALLQRTHTWVITGNTAIGSYFPQVTRPCFTDSCPNIAGDQDGAPSGTAINTSGNCVPVTTSCIDTDMEPGDTNEDGVDDACVPVELGECEVGVPVDTNGNENPDRCVTLTPVLDCVTTHADGGLTAYFHATNTNAVVVEAPAGPDNSFAGSDATPPSTFPVGSSEQFSVEVSGGAESRSVTWNLTGASATASAESVHCFEDACPNLGGDQRDVPEGLVVNDRGECVAAPPSCDVLVSSQERGLTIVTTMLGETPTDTDGDGDGVIDTCVPPTCTPDMLPVDSGSNGVADSCKPIAIECPAGQEAQDLIPAGKPNGVLDTCVTKTSAGPTGSDGTGGTGGTGGTAAPGGDGGSSAPGDSDTSGDDGSAAPDDSATDGDDEAEQNAAGSDSETVAAAADEATNGGGLPYTGAALGLLLLIGIGAVGAGVITRRAARREEDAIPAPAQD